MDACMHMCGFLLCMKVPQCPSDYRVWQETMYTQFGQKWAKLHHGPMWASIAGDGKLDTMEVFVLHNFILLTLFTTIGKG